MGKNNKSDIAKDFFEKGFILQNNGHLDRAAHFYRRSIEFYPSAKAYTYLGWVLSLKGLYDKAIEECKHAIDLDPSYGNPYNDIGAYLLQQNKFDEAMDWLKKALDAPNYKNYCYPWLNLGRVYEFKGHWDEALKCYKMAIQENDNYTPAEQALQSLLAKHN
ncbi:MAG: tetratricopeptide repeat protein [Calditrichaeota bacterium]|nr:MAG: tetratricopeptide repeat protein [Calditrichota bacterium]MBL1206001.1 tetratricopeptide repeat protein [Calditrichota bacterium]NOG45829.1 tetratricopeptide repeat protein [Calditrichota bacterium]